MQNPQNTPHLPFPPPEYPTTGDPLSNLSTIQSHLNSLSQTLSNSVNSYTPLSPLQSSTISSQLSNAILHVIINGASLITSSSSSSHILPSSSDGQDLEIIELDVDTLTADQSHVCEFCGKGFKRDANLRMHMRAHGDQFKTLESLAKPSNNNAVNNNNNTLNGVIRKVRFSCPYVGCERNKSHKKFRPLKSAVCVKNHFKRFHCAKMFTCNKCKCKSFSVLADLKRHMKNCATSSMTSAVELCSCGLKFGTKDELFGHVSVSEGHMPATYDGNDSNNNVINDCNNNNNNNNNNNSSINRNNKVEDYEGFGLIEDDQDMRLWSSIEELFNF